ncbi:MAG: DUF58 domain-containing protein [Myxococcota bacterium]|jgi:uncharacterized protein (DUF58 family)|nr:DUF58 domain-containing protein [Myxococcota bacterium]
MLSSDLIKQVKQIEIRTGRQVADVLAGEYLSVFKGVGLEFDEVRPYVPGDDVRSIDWNVTARMGAPFVKRFVEERELTVLLLVDVSASLDFGSLQRSKREAATELSALLAFAAIKNDDKVGLLLFHGAVEQYIPPRKGQKHALRVVREVLAPAAESQQERARDWMRWPRMLLRRFLRLRELRASDPRRHTNIRMALEFLQKVVKRRAVVFVISDFLDEGFIDTLRTAHRKHDVVCVQVFDRRERELAPSGLVELEDQESGQTRVVDLSSEAFRQAAQSSNRARDERLQNQLAASGVDLIRIDATEPVVEPLVAFFRARQRRYR